MITILSDPSYIVQVSPELISRLLATESPNNFRLQRKDWLVTGSSESTGSPAGCLDIVVTSFTGNIGDDIVVHDSFNNAIYTGKVVDTDGTNINTDIPWVATMVIDYMNDNTLYGGYYFEGRLTVNDVVQTLTVIASPDSFGKADLDVSGILRIMTSLLKVGDYSAQAMAETTKSGKFTLAYRGCWYGSDESYIEEGNTWYYAEAVRSEEQGSNLHEYDPAVGEALFLNAFERPVYFAGLPFDISFMVSAGVASVNVVTKRYNSSNTLLATDTDSVAVTGGRVNSLNIDPAGIEASAAYMTIEIDLP